MSESRLQRRWYEEVKPKNLEYRWTSGLSEGKNIYREKEEKRKDESELNYESVVWLGLGVFMSLLMYNVCPISNVSLVVIDNW